MCVLTKLRWRSERVTRQTETCSSNNLVIINGLLTFCTIQFPCILLKFLFMNKNKEQTSGVSFLIYELLMNRSNLIVRFEVLMAVTLKTASSGMRCCVVWYMYQHSSKMLVLISQIKWHRISKIEQHSKSNDLFCLLY
jgi:heme/copper-type cytochrome/quinol oxidase subunit 4